MAETPDKECKRVLLKVTDGLKEERHKHINKSGVGGQNIAKKRTWLRNSRNKTPPEMLEIKKSNQIKAVENITSRLDYTKEYKGWEPEQKKCYIQTTEQW